MLHIDCLHRFVCFCVRLPLVFYHFFAEEEIEILNLPMAPAPPRYQKRCPKPSPRRKKPIPEPRKQDGPKYNLKVSKRVSFKNPLTSTLGPIENTAQPIDRRVSFKNPLTSTLGPIDNTAQPIDRSCCIIL